jgi:hypothetical protein
MVVTSLLRNRIRLIGLLFVFVRQCFSALGRKRPDRFAPVRKSVVSLTSACFAEVSFRWCKPSYSAPRDGCFATFFVNKLHRLIKMLNFLVQANDPDNLGYTFQDYFNVPNSLGGRILMLLLLLALAALVIYIAYKLIKNIWSGEGGRPLH